MYECGVCMCSQKHTHTGRQAGTQFHNCYKLTFGLISVITSLSYICIYLICAWLYLCISHGMYYKVNGLFWIWGVFCYCFAKSLSLSFSLSGFSIYKYIIHTRTVVMRAKNHTKVFTLWTYYRQQSKLLVKSYRFFGEEEEEEAECNFPMAPSGWSN